MASFQAAFKAAIADGLSNDELASDARVIAASARIRVVGLTSNGGL
jgi:hypothetical protein